MNKRSIQVLLASCAYSMIPMVSILSSAFMLRIDYGADYSVAFTVVTAAAEVLLMGIPALFMLAFPQGRALLLDPVYRRFNLRTLLAVPIAVVGFFAIISLNMLWIALLDSIGASNQLETLSDPAGPNELWMGVLAIAVAPAITEEFLFRGLMQSAYKGMKPLKMALIVGGLFAFMHGNTAALPAHLVLGVLICLVVYLSGSFWAGVIMHFIHNTLSLSYSLLVEQLLPPQALEEAAQASVGAAEVLQYFIGFVVCAAVVAGLLFLLQRLNKRDTQRALDGQSPCSQPPEPISKLSFLPLIPGVVTQLGIYLLTFVAMFVDMSGGIG